MPFILGAAGSAVGGLLGGLGSMFGASSQANAEKDAINLQKQIWQQTQKNLSPFIGAGGGAVGALQAGIGTPGNPGPWSKPFDPSNLSSTPGYQFALHQGEQGILDTASATGGIGGGNTLKALTQFGTGLADQTFQQQLADYMAQQQQAFGQQYNLASLAENAAAGQGSIGANTGANIAGDIAGLGNAQAGGIVGLTNGITGGINSLMQNYMLSNLINGGGGGGSFFSPNALDFTGLTG